MTDTSSTPSIPTLRRALVTCEEVLRSARVAEKLLRLDLEQKTIDRFGGSKALGANEDERTRRLTLALYENVSYRTAVNVLREAENAAETARTELTILLDERTEAHWVIRERYVRILEQTGAMIQADVPMGQPS